MDVRKQGTGYRPDPIDVRDYRLFSAYFLKPESVSYRDFFLDVRNQEDDNTCVGFSTTAVKEYYDNKERGTKDYFSPRHLYWHCKQIDGDPNEEGTYPRVAMKILQEIGVANENEWPYQSRQTNVPSDMDRIDSGSAPQKILSYARLSSTRDMITNLMKNGPFVAGVLVTEGWYTNKAINTGLIDASIEADASSGGHAICVCGYDAKKELFLARNSWGEDYGDKGYIWLPRAWMGKYCIDAWSLVDDTQIDSSLVLVKPQEGANI